MNMHRRSEGSDGDYKFFFNTVPFPVLILDEKEVIIASNRKFRKIFDCDPEEILMTLSDAKLHQNLVTGCQKIKAQLRDQGVCETHIEIQLTTASGEKQYFQLHGKGLVNGNGFNGRVLILFNDITVQKSREKEQHNIERRLNHVQSMAKLGFLDWDLRSNEIFLSPEAYAIHDISPDESLTTPELVARSVHPDDKDLVNSKLQAAITGEDTYDLDHRIRHRDGSIHWVHATAELYRDQSGTPIKLLGTVVDITERKSAQLETEMLNRIFNMLGSINRIIVREKEIPLLFKEVCRIGVEQGALLCSWICEYDEDAQKLTLVAQANLPSALVKRLSIPHSAAFYGLLGKECMELGKSQYYPRPDMLKEKNGIFNEVFMLGASGIAMLPLIVEHKCSALYYCCATIDCPFTRETLNALEEIAIDLAFAMKFAHAEELRKKLENEQKQLESQFAKSQRLEAIGRLAGGVAHDFNNMLHVIIGYGQLIKSELKEIDPLYRQVNEIVEAADRSASLTRQLLAFSRKQTIAPVTLQLNDCIQQLLKLLKRLVGENITLDFIPGADLGHIKMDPSQIDQILANLVINARDAIKDQGEITIETTNAVIDETYGVTHVDFHTGDHVLMSISDNGSGIKPELLDKIFDPFFTTKEEGVGTGLGLSTVYGIMKQNNGFINVYSEEGKGTTFKLYFPRYEGDGVVHSVTTEEVDINGNELVLLVEDEHKILEIAKQWLEKLGYTVLTATHPGEALLIAEHCEMPLDLLITDVIMPGMNGLQLQARLLEKYPDMKTLFMSGYTPNAIIHYGVLDEDKEFIQKPFNLTDLAKKIRHILDK